MAENGHIERDQLGFINERCPHCGACLFLSDVEVTAGRGEERAICLNGCRLPGYLWKRLHSLPGGLLEKEGLEREDDAAEARSQARHQAR